jgi:hypothetical protein
MYQPNLNWYSQLLLSLHNTLLLIYHHRDGRPYYNFSQQSKQTLRVYLSPIQLSLLGYERPVSYNASGSFAFLVVLKNHFFITFIIEDVPLEQLRIF